VDPAADGRRAKAGARARRLGSVAERLLPQERLPARKTEARPVIFTRTG
jgi:hypothetical protein